jgi:5-methylcytosine-specific restriction endonuclease McrA
MGVEKKYKIEDLIELINQNKSTDEIATYYNVTGRTIRYWFKKENLESNVRNDGFNNLKNLTKEQRTKITQNLVNFQKEKLKDRVICFCETCNGEYSVTKSVFKLGTRFCSKDCLYTYLFKTNPENHPRWLGGKSQENQIGRGTLEYQEWRINVWKRDFFTCKKCLKIGKDLNAHHINSWVDNVDDRYSIDNGVTLCGDCHKNLHKIYGQKTNEQNLKEFLNLKDNNGWKRLSLESF